MISLHCYHQTIRTLAVDKILYLFEKCGHMDLNVFHLILPN